MIFSVYKNGKEVGTAVVECFGMQYLIRCLCPELVDRAYSVVLHLDDRRIDLGMMIPEKTGGVLTRRIPKNEIDTASMRFEISEYRKVQKYSVKEFADNRMINKLPNAVIRREAGEIWLVLQNQTTISNPTGQ